MIFVFCTYFLNLISILSIGLIVIVHRFHIYILSIQLILIICRFCICKFTYLLKFICNSRISNPSASVVICWCKQSSKKFQSPFTHILSLGGKRRPSSFLFYLSYLYKQVSFQIFSFCPVCFCATSFVHFGFILLFFCFLEMGA